MRVSLFLAGGVSAKVYFQESFHDLSRWTHSTWKSESELEKFQVKAGKWSLDAEKEELALATTKDARFYAASAKFDKFSNEGKKVSCPISGEIR